MVRLLRTGLASLLATLSALAAGSVPASAVDVPPDAWVTIHGHGYGHGHGMSQYGAEGAARRGLAARDIVRFYYPGTVLGSTSGTVKVKITADDDNTTKVLPRPGLQVRDLANGQTWTLFGGVDRWALRVGADGRSQLWYHGATWRLWRVLAGDGMFTAGGAPITLVLPDGSTVAYRGELWSRRPSPDSRRRDTINRLLLESYLRGVVPREIPATWSPAAVRAQAIAARSYAAYERAHPLSPTYQICDTTSCQVYGGYSAEHPDSNAAIDATRNLILRYGGEPAFTQFSASSGGWTSRGSVPYLVAKQDPYDGWAGNPYHTWSLRVDDSRIERAFPAIGNLRAIRVLSRDGNGDWGGRILTMALDGGQGSVRVSGSEFRSRLDLRSDWLRFSVTAK